MHLLQMAALSLLGGCIIFDTSPAYQRMLELTDEDGDGSTLADGDCNDADPRIFPQSPEVCDGLDNDCDYTTDEDGGVLDWCLDRDGDGHGDVSTTNHACLIPADGVTTCDDCNDTDPTIYPSAQERCDGIDNNCDAVVDDDASVDASTWYLDDDGDGYGERDRTTMSCLLPDGYAAYLGDCEDDDPAVNPGMLETCNNGMDDNCDGSAGGCGFAGSEDLEPHGISGVDGGYVAGPSGTREDLGRGTYIVDVSADGLPDIVLRGNGDMYGEYSGGSVHLWYGTPVGYQEVSGAGAHLYGAAGLALAFDDSVLSTDVDGDGVVELLLGALGTGEGFADAGQILIFEAGLSGTREVEPSDTWVVGTVAEEYLGAGLQRADDLVGDGEYVMVGAYGYSEVADSAGRIYVMNLGAPDPAAPAATVSGTEAQDYVGSPQAPLTDLDGDGFDDLAIGTPYRSGDEGLVTLFHGPLHGDYLLDDGDTTISEPGTRSFGRRLTTVADPEGAGTGRLIVTSAGASDGDYDGAVHILNATLDGAEVLSDVTHAVVNGEVDRGSSQLRLDRGDLNGDGTDDLLVGDLDLDRDEITGYSGAVYLLTDPLSLVGTRDLAEASTARFYGRSSGDHLGASLAIGDANHDGRNDLLFAGDNVELESDPGGVYFLLGEGM